MYWVRSGLGVKRPKLVLDQKYQMALISVCEHDKTVGTVRKSWIKNIENTLYTYWKNSQKLKRSIIHREIPSPTTWSLYSIKIEKSYDTYDEAQNKLNRLERGKVTTTEDEAPPRGRRAVRRVPESGAGTSSAVATLTGEKIVNIPTTPPSIQPSRTQASRPEKIQTRNFRESAVIESALFELPISNVGELIGLESELKLGERKSKPSNGSRAVTVNEKMAGLVFEFASVGGERLTEATHRVLTCLMTDEIMAKYSFVGKKGKRAFCDFPFLLSSVIRAVRSIISEAEDAIKY
ncbi:hypothetical protein Fcan01_11274 [Folsomia candida]|uniref:DUF4806 domain-containing protein n=1 Tax=Folsomia candida TaxID=158441 RepID=A0A226EC84_FOLCA|nr:hypothetical protein Fcan01_11274 [Folsomia candida]